MTETPPPVILSGAPAERRISFCIAWNVFSSYQDKATLDATTLKLQIQNSQKTNSKSQNANSKHSISNYNFQETNIFSFVFIRVICGQSFFFRPLRGLVPCQADSFLIQKFYSIVPEYLVKKILLIPNPIVDPLFLIA